MKKNLLISICLLFFLSTCQKKEPFDYKLLEGEWLFVKKSSDTKAFDKDGIPPPPNPGIMPLSLRNFKGDCSDSIYKVINDTILFKVRPRRDQKNECLWVSTFIIQKLTKDSLMLYGIKNSAEYTFYNSDFDKDTSIHVSRICFSSSGCYGTCPSINLEMNKDDSVYYEGMSFTKKKGLFVGKISQKTFCYFEELVQKANIEKLDSAYSSSITDSQAIGINIFYNNGKTKSAYIYPAFGYDLPFINLLSENLMRFDSYFPLTESKKSYHFPHNNYPINFKIPLLLETKKFTPPVVE